MEQRLRIAGALLSDIRAAERGQSDRARELAIEAHEDTSLSQRRIAELLGVDRMTVRKWVGKR